MGSQEDASLLTTGAALISATFVALVLFGALRAPDTAFDGTDAGRHTSPLTGRREERSMVANTRDSAAHRTEKTMRAAGFSAR
jgi:hypothetical protein